MGIIRRLPGLRGTFILAATALVVISAPAFGQTPELVVEVRDTTAWPDSVGTLTIYMQNYQDTVAGFELWLQLSRPDLMQFQQELDTTFITFYWDCLVWDGEDCLDSVDVTDTVLQDPSYPYDFATVDTQIVMEALFDSTGTLVSGWQYVEARSLGGMGYDIKIAALANMLPPPYQTGIPPQNGEVPLVRLPFTTMDVLDTLTERTVDVMIVPILDHFSFSTPQGQSIGVQWQEVYDTTYYICLQWLGDICLLWEEVPGPPYDSLYVDTSWIPVLDTTVVQLIDGQVRILGECIEIPLPGDVDGDGTYHIAELTTLIDFIHHGEPPLGEPRNADVNGDCCIDWDDVTLLQQGGPFADCTCLEPVWCCCRDYRGNADYDQDDNTNIVDLVFLVTYLFDGGPAPWCFDEADANYDGNVNIADVTYYVGYLFQGFAPPPSCPSYVE